MPIGVSSQLGHDQVKKHSITLLAQAKTWQMKPEHTQSVMIPRLGRMPTKSGEQIWSVLLLINFAYM